MASKRALEKAEKSASADKKPRQAFKVGPDNLPDGPWRRKVTKIKKDLIHKAKIKKQYAKIKAQHERLGSEKRPLHANGDQGAPDAFDDMAPVEEDDSDEEEAAESMHPTRQLMLADEDKAQQGAADRPKDGVGPDEAAGAGDAGDTGIRDGHRRRTRRPGYYDKQLQKANERKMEADRRAEEAQKRREERERKLAERQRYGRAMKKTIGRDGKKKLGRESSLLLEKVKRLMEK